MINANALDQAANAVAEYLTTSRAGRTLAQNLAEALDDYQTRAYNAGQSDKYTLTTIAETLANALAAALAEPAQEREALERAKAHEHQARDAADRAARALEYATADRQRASTAYENAKEANHEAARLN